ncbi:hypothetical protein SAY87_030635 [Trapa incisa]|uniref:Protein PHYTOCHROME KINASE SUBSTRATE 4 n=1 Tax=Trapa incisa TaxID=236973 RepID=A0AAN7QM36_9MYRT|nr:hypothetical protein SAY87_030635 [Trapa incisa]
MASSSVSSISSFPLSQPVGPSFPLNSSSSPSHQNKQPLTTEELPLPNYVKPADDGGRQGAAARDDLELNIFDARKYFSIETSFEPNLSTASRITPSVPRFSPASPVDEFSMNYRTRSFRSYATPTASCEASWNNHTGLLTRPPGMMSVTLRDPTSDRKSRHGRSDSPRWMLFRRRCPCSCKKSVQVKEGSPETRSPESRQSKSRPKQGEAAEAYGINKFDDLLMKTQSMTVPNAIRRFSNGGFTFPVLEPSIPYSPLPPSATKLLIHGFPRPKTASVVVTSLSLPLADDPARNSIEVFQHSGGPSEVHNAYPASPHQRVDALSVNDDAASDASSDLFEIESFSTQSNSISFPAAAYSRPRDPLDEARTRLSSAAAVGIYGCLDGQSAALAYDAATECGYEPSEANVTWSVTTAEGTAFDDASFTNYSISASDVEEFARIQLHQHRELGRRNGSSSSNESRRRDSGGLLTSCRWEKAVSVGPNPIKSLAEKGRDRYANYYKPAL